MATTLISDQMRAAVGAEMERVSSFPIGQSDIRKWALAVYYPDPPPRLFWDAEHAATTRYGGMVAPEDFNPFAWLTTRGPRPAGEDIASTSSHEARLGIAPPPVRFGLNGGTESEFGVRMRPGDEITSVTRLHSYTEREGRLGVMLFTITESTWTNQSDELVKVVRQTSIRY